MRSILLRRTGDDVSPLERRVQFSPPHLSSCVRLCGRLAVRNRRLCRTDRARRDGVRDLLQIHHSRRAAAAARVLRHLACSARPSRRRQVRRRLSQHLDGTQACADPCFHRRRFCVRRRAIDFICTERSRSGLYRRCAIRHQPRFRDVFLLRLECRDLYRRRSARTRPQPAACAVHRNGDRHRSLRSAQRGLSAYHADEGIGRPDRCRHRRRQACVRRNRRPRLSARSSPLASCPRSAP